MVRPTVYKTFTHFIYALVLSLLWNEFINKGMLSRAYAFIFFAVFFAGAAWVNYLKLDGMKMPKMPDWVGSITRRTQRAQGDIADYVDEPIVSFDELEEDEKSICCLIADVVCFILFILISFI